jgi:spore coat protein CotH
MMGLEYPEVKGSLEFNGKTYPNIGVRFKGNSSFMMAANTLKKSFKLDINKFDKKQSLSGITKISLNNNASDGSQMREALSYEVFRRANVPASRTAYTRLYITVPGVLDKQYAGLYTMVEQVGGKFLNTHFGSSDGLLMKPETRRGLPYLGDDWTAYQRAYDPKGDDDREVAQKAIAFIKFVDTADDATFAKEIGSYLDVDEFLRFLAVNAVLANGDSLLAMGHNFYLYLDPKTNKFSWIPWDLNMSFAGFPMGQPAKLPELSYLHPHVGEHKLIDKLLADKETREAYTKAVRTVLASAFTKPELFKQIADVRAVIRPAIAEESTQALQQFDRAVADMATASPVSQGRTASTGQAGTRAGSGAPAGRNGLANTGRIQGSGIGGPGNSGGAGGLGNPVGQGGPGGPGGGRGFRGPMMQSPPLQSFIVARIASLQLQLDGKSEGYVPQGGFGPGGPGGPGGQFGGPAAMLAGQIIRAAGGAESGRVSVQQLAQAAAGWAAQWDGDRDGALSREETASGINALLGIPGGDGGPGGPEGFGQGGPPPGFGPGMFIGPQLMNAAGAGGDRISRQAFAGAFARWARSWDRDNNGILDPGEIQEGLSRIVRFPEGPGGFRPPGEPGGPPLARISAPSSRYVS